MSVDYASEIRRPGESPGCGVNALPRTKREQGAAPRTAFETILQMWNAWEDPECHDGWQPVRARHANERRYVDQE